MKLPNVVIQVIFKHIPQILRTHGTSHTHIPDLMSPIRRPPKGQFECGFHVSISIHFHTCYP